MLFDSTGDTKADVTTGILFCVTLIVTLISRARGWPTYVISPVAMLVGMMIFRVVHGQPIRRANLITVAIILVLYTWWLWTLN
jgi:hypothetical protein